ncbi:hypothetical protein SynPROS71_01729 [Synechococcus sp. PROS-7-1]|nr:hypothetical protein SynBMKMC1_01802 [Synechococcus sp. BMK-MC-1]QNI85516.1 hypothetical protein SynPROS71_01729 [Synechococcus sp. PROS-7-1]QNJ06325.1 hypothetical protein SynMEDNS5_01608 [Synechococcus sp. MEDNS5]
MHQIQRSALNGSLPQASAFRLQHQGLSNSDHGFTDHMSIGPTRK